MSSNALYFPYISVPDGRWTTQMLLYWDQLSSIVPYDHVAQPELLSPYMRDLVEVGLVQQVFAPMHLADVHAFSEAFVHLLESRLAHLHAHPTAQRTLVHIEKLGPIASYLEQQDLAQATDYPWFSVDERVASWFMTYLAVILGASDTLDAAPITNRLEYASLLGGSPRLFDRPAAPLHRQKARNALLLELLPVPDVAHIAPYELARFKDDHKASLRRMRTVVEAECGKIARIEDAEARREATEAFVAQSRSELGDIVEAMAGRWNIVNFGSLCALGAAGITAATTDLPAGAAGKLTLSLSLLGSIAMAVGTLRQNRGRQIERPLAYAAHVRTRWTSAST